MINTSIFRPLGLVPDPNQTKSFTSRLVALLSIGSPGAPTLKLYMTAQVANWGKATGYWEVPEPPLITRFKDLRLLMA